MLSFPNAASIAAAAEAVSDPRLQTLLADGVNHWRASGLLPMTHLLIVEPGDSEEDIVREVGFSPLVSPLDGSRFGSSTFRPFWDLLIDRGGWFELTMTVGNSGFAFVLFIQDAPGVEPELLALCRAHAQNEGN